MIELRDVVVAYDTRVILDSVNLTIEDGETLVIWVVVVVVKVRYYA